MNLAKPLLPFGDVEGSGGPTQTHNSILGIIAMAAIAA
jgi:hypothetical protein